MAKGSKDKSMHDVVIISSLEIPKYVNIARAKDKVIALFGGPGIGKTSGIKEAARQMADDMGLKFVEQPTPEDWKDRGNFCYRIILSTYLNEEDTNGIPFKYTMADGKEVTRYLPTELFPEDGIGMIVFDEYANGRNGVMQALQQMILEHTAGNIKISKDIQFVVASNRPSDNTGCNEVPDATKNRLMWCEVSIPSVKDFLKKMDSLGQPLEPSVAAFLLSIGSQYFDNHGDEAEQYAYGSPRSIVAGSDMIKGESDITEIAKLFGMAVGRKAGQELAAFIELTQKIDVEALLKNPKLIHQYEDDTGKMYSLALNFVDRCVSTPTTTEAVMQILVELKPVEFGVFVINNLMDKWGDNRALERISKCACAKDVGMKYFKILKRDIAAAK